jgi:hypothetical protein
VRDLTVGELAALKDVGVEIVDGVEVA